MNRGTRKAMADRTVAPGDARALEARPLLPPPTRPRRVEDERSDADSVPDAPGPLVPGDDPLYPVYTAATDAPWSLVPGDDPLYPVYTPTVPQSPVHDETYREFASELSVHLRDAFRDRPHKLASDVNLYYEDAHPPPGRAPGRQPAPIAPDLMLFLRTIEASPYRSYRTWEVGAPAWVLEILSYRTWKDDVGDKRALYARLGVKEYWFYDPEGVQLPDAAGTLRGFRLRAGVYEAIAPLRRVAGGAVATVYPSTVLGVALGVDRQRHLRLYDAGRQAWYQTANEAQAEAQTERDARQQAETQAQAERDARQQAETRAQAERDARQQAETRAQAAAEQAQAERDARQQAEARLQALLARLQMSDDDELDSPRP